MGNKKSQTKKKHTPMKLTERKIKGAMAALVVLIILVAGYGISGQKKGLFNKIGIKEPWITSVSIGPEYGQIEKTDKKGNFRIEVSLPIDTDITQISCTLETSEGALDMMESNCIITDLGGKLLLNLGVEKPKLVLKAGEDSDAEQVYNIVLSISE